MTLVRLCDQRYGEGEDPIPTETTIISLLRKTNLAHHPSFMIADYNWAIAINRDGVSATQALIDRFLDYCPLSSIPIFICQHISVRSLRWGRSIVFSPHATINSRLLPIAHFSVNYATSFTPITQRTISCSFMGSLDTHPIRRTILDKIRGIPRAFTCDTGMWFFSNPSTSYVEQYKAILQSSIISVCPLGTGPGSVRLWEALSSGSIPLIVSENLMLPYPIHDKVVIISTNKIDDLEGEISRILAMSPVQLVDYQQNLYRAHMSNCFNNVLHMPIINFIRHHVSSRLKD